MADRVFWSQTDPARLARIERLVLAIQTSPFAGIGKPEPLR